MKIVINKCFGGFGLSRAAVLRAREISGDPAWGGPTIRGDVDSDGTSVGFDYGHINEAQRHDPVLVRVVEEMGRAANGQCASLAVVDIPAGTAYRITEYDGREDIETADEIVWSVAT